jgi:hypothetical protein
MRGHDYRQLLTSGERVQNGDDLFEVRIGAHVLLAVRAHEEKPVLLQLVPFQCIRRFDSRPVVLQNLEHRASRLDHRVGRDSFAQQILTRDVAVREIDVGGVVNDSAVDLLGDTLVEAPVPRFHMEDRDLAALRRNDGQRAVGVAEHEQRFRSDALEKRIEGDDYPADRLRGSRAGRLEEMVRLPHLEILEEDLVQLVVVVLTGVDDVWSQ